MRVSTGLRSKAPLWRGGRRQRWRRLGSLPNLSLVLRCTCLARSSPRAPLEGQRGADPISIRRQAAGLPAASDPVQPHALPCRSDRARLGSGLRRGGAQAVVLHDDGDPGVALEDDPIRAAGMRPGPRYPKRRRDRHLARKSQTHAGLCPSLPARRANRNRWTPLRRIPRQRPRRTLDQEATRRLTSSRAR